MAASSLSITSAYKKMRHQVNTLRFSTYNWILSFSVICKEYDCFLSKEFGVFCFNSSVLKTIVLFAFKVQHICNEVGFQTVFSAFGHHHGNVTTQA